MRRFPLDRDDHFVFGKPRHRQRRKVRVCHLCVLSSCRRSLGQSSWSVLWSMADEALLELPNGGFGAAEWSGDAPADGESDSKRQRRENGTRSDRPSDSLTMYTQSATDDPTDETHSQHLDMQLMPRGAWRVISHLRGHRYHCQFSAASVDLVCAPRAGARPSTHVQAPPISLR